MAKYWRLVRPTLKASHDVVRCERELIGTISAVTHSASFQAIAPANWGNGENYQLTRPSQEICVCVITQY